MDTLEWLKSYRVLHDRLIYMNNRIRGVKSISFDESSGTGKSLNELIDEKTKIIKQMKVIENAINSLEDGILSMVLGYRFLLFYTAERTADEMGYSVIWIKKLTKKAINSIR